MFFNVICIDEMGLANCANPLSVSDFICHFNL
jgi:hypothetical protein